MPRPSPHHSLAEDLTMLPHKMAYGKEQALSPHMAVWMRQGCLPSLQAHMDKVLSCFQAWGVLQAFPMACHGNKLSSAAKLGSTQSQSYAAEFSKQENGTLANL